MPKVSFYLRNEDVEAWKTIDKKTAWVHNRLTEPKVEDATLYPMLKQLKETGTYKPVPQPTHYKPTDDWGA